MGENARREEAKLLELDVSSRKFDSPEGFGGQVTSMERDPASLPSAPPPSSALPPKTAFPPSHLLETSCARRSASLSFSSLELVDGVSISLALSLSSTLHPSRDQLLSRASLAWQRFHGTDVCTYRIRIYAPLLALGTSTLWKILSPSVKGCEIRRFVNGCIAPARSSLCTCTPDVLDSPLLHLSIGFLKLFVRLSIFRESVVLSNTLYLPATPPFIIELYVSS